MSFYLDARLAKWPRICADLIAFSERVAEHPDYLYIRCPRAFRREIETLCFHLDIVDRFSIVDDEEAGEAALGSLAAWPPDEGARVRGPGLRNGQPAVA